MSSCVACEVRYQTGLRLGHDVPETDNDRRRSTPGKRIGQENLYSKQGQILRKRIFSRSSSDYDEGGNHNISRSKKEEPKGDNNLRVDCKDKNPALACSQFQTYHLQALVFESRSYIQVSAASI